jgi:hypothetical protein
VSFGVLLTERVVDVSIAGAGQGMLVYVFGFCFYALAVLHKGYAFGFDGSILSCIDLADGKRKWKGGRSGCRGQKPLPPFRNHLLVPRHVQCSVIFWTRQLFMSATSRLFSVGQAMP